jgi:hypothetical protein
MTHTQVDEAYKLSFEVDRKAKSCRTPRRNDDVTAALVQLVAVYEW